MFQGTRHSSSLPKDKKINKVLLVVIVSIPPGATCLLQYDYMATHLQQLVQETVIEAMNVTNHAADHFLNLGKW